MPGCCDKTSLPLPALRRTVAVGGGAGGGVAVDFVGKATDRGGRKFPGKRVPRCCGCCRTPSPIPRSRLPLNLGRYTAFRTQQRTCNVDVCLFGYIALNALCHFRDNDPGGVEDTCKPFYHERP